MAKNTVKNAKEAARKVLTAVVDKVKVKGKVKGKDKGKDKGKAPKVKPADMSEARKEVKVKGKGSKHLSDVSTAKNTLGRGAARAKVMGYACSAIWRACGFQQDRAGEFVWTVSEALALRDGLGLNGVIRDANVRAQFYDGRNRANGGNGFYGGDVPALTGDQWKELRKLAGK